MADRKYDKLKIIEITFNFIFILVYPLMFISLGMDLSDGPWNIRMTLSPESFMPYWLTAKIGYLWVSVFGNGMLSYRLLYYTFVEVIILLFYLVFFQNKNILLFSRYTLIAIILTISTTSYIFSYGALTSLFLVILFLGLFKYTQTNKLRYIFILGLVSSSAFLARLPNIVIIPAVFLLLALFSYVKFIKTLIPFKQRFFFLMKLWMVYGISCLLLLSLFFLFITTPHDFYTSVFENLSTEAQSETYHSLHIILTNYLRDLIALAKDLSVIIILFFSFKLTVNYLKIKKWIIGVVIFVMYLGFLSITNPGDYNFGFSVNTTAFIFFVISNLFYHFYRQKKHLHLFILISIIIFLFIPAIGSNTGLLKMKSFANFIIIFLMYWTYKENIKTGLQKYFISILLMALVSYGIYNRITWFYGESDKISELKYTVQHEKLKFIKTTSYRMELVEKIVKEIDKNKLAENDILFFGRAGQLFYYLYDQPGLSKQLFYLETDDKNVLKQLEFLLNKEKKHPLIVIVFGHPNNPNWPQILSDPKNKDKVKDLEKSKDLIKMLTENLYQAVVSDKAFVIFNYNSQI